jgi:autotransporter-associated beta strand protein
LPDLTVGSVLTSGTNNAGAVGTTGLIKAGTGLMQLQQQNTYTGTTTVSAGTLQLADGSSNGISTSAVISIASAGTLDVTNESGSTIALNSAQVLGGSGTVKGNVQVASGSKLSAGTSTALATGANAVGKLTTTGNQEWDGGGTYVWKITGPGTVGQAIGSGASTVTPGTNSDDVVLSALTVSASTGTPFTISLTTAAAANGAIGGTNGQYSWILAETGSTALPTNISDSGNLLAGGNSAQAGLFALDTTNFSMNGVTHPGSNLFSLEFEPIGAGGKYDLVLDYAAAPEPGTALLVMGGVLPMLMGRRRRRNKQAQ